MAALIATVGKGRQGEQLFVPKKNPWALRRSFALPAQAQIGTERHGWKHGRAAAKKIAFGEIFFAVGFAGSSGQKIDGENCPPEACGFLRLGNHPTFCRCVAILWKTLKKN